MDFDFLAGKIEALGCTVLRDEPLSRHTSFQIGGNTRLFVRTQDIPSLSGLVTLLKAEGVPFFLMGKGSNLLAADEGFEGCVVQIERTREKELFLLEDGCIYAGAGVSLAKLCLFARDHSFTGLEFAWGIPGSVGGGIYMNAGAYGGEMRDVLRSVFFLDGDGAEQSLPVETLALSYRHSRFMEVPDMITGGIFQLKKGNSALIRDQMEELYARRKAKQPLEFPSAGSAFKRPQGAYASALIEQCGLKGLAVGGAQVSEKHCGFIVNTGKATAQDVKGLMRKVVRTVWEKTGYRLEPEVRGLPDTLLADLKRE